MFAREGKQGPSVFRPVPPQDQHSTQSMQQRRPE